jgi:hypothetical protein
VADTADTFKACDTQQIIEQVGRMNILAISGGRIIRRETGITLPVGAGYSVTIDLTSMDDYEVRRVFKRGSKIWIKGVMRGVYCGEVGEVAYKASCFRNGPEYWNEKEN